MLRWALVVPAALAGWFVSLLVGLVLLHLVDRLCPEDQRVSGACIAPWHATVTDGIVLVCAALAAALIVLLPALVAPREKRTVAHLAFGGGLLFALYAAVQTGAYGSLAAAAASGWLTVAWVRRRWPAGEASRPA